MAIEEEFSIEIPDKDADSIHSGTPSSYSSPLIIGDAGDNSLTQFLTRS